MKWLARLAFGTLGLAFSTEHCSDSPSANPVADGSVPAADTGAADSSPTPMPDASPDALGADTGADARVDANSDSGPATVSISGRVVSYKSGFANVKVYVQGKEATTDATGGFTLSGITLPYDISAVLEGNQSASSTVNARVVTTYVGVRSLAPVLTVVGKGGLAIATVSGALAVDPSVARAVGSRFQVIASGSLILGGVAFPKEPGFTFSVATNFPADVAQTKADYFALSGSSAAAGFPTFDPLLGVARQVSLTRGMDPPALSIMVARAALGQVHGRFSIPVGYTQVKRLLRFFSNDTAAYFDDSSTPELSVMIPKEPALLPEIGVFAQDATSGARTLIYSSATIDGPEVVVSVPLAHALVAPAAGAPAVGKSDEFSWTSPTPNCVYGINIRSPQAGSTEHLVWTTQAATKLPDLAGLGLTAGATYAWSSRCIIFESNNIDAHATLEGSPFKGYVELGNRQFVAK
jgi:hypothetical protein